MTSEQALLLLLADLRGTIEERNLQNQELRLEIDELVKQLNEKMSAEE